MPERKPSKRLKKELGLFDVYEVAGDDGSCIDAQSH